MSGGFAAGAVAGYGVALPVGAIGAYMVGLGARESWRTACAAALGVATTDGAYALIAGVAGGAAARVIRPAAGPLTLVGAVVLVGLAARTATVAARRHRSPASTAAATAASLRPARAYLTLVALTGLNPTTLLYFAALVVGGGPSRGGAVVAFAAGAFVASASWQLLLVGGGRALAAVLGGRSGRLAVAATSSVIMVALAVRLIAT